MDFQYKGMLNVSTDNGEMKVYIADISPEQAKELLTCNTNNRRQKKGRIQRYASDMSNGMWKENGVPIVFSNKVLKDGQHRLESCVASGVTLKKSNRCHFARKRSFVLRYRGDKKYSGFDGF